MIRTEFNGRQAMYKTFLWLVLLLPAVFSYANDEEERLLEVIDAYADVHSGPGRGYPVFYTIENGEKIEVLTRRPDWYEVKTQNGKIGWVTTSAISRTIQTTGEPADLPSVGYGDYIKNAWLTGFSTGQFNAGGIDGYEFFSVTGGYRVLSWLAGDLEYGRLFGADFSGEFYGANLYVEPFSNWKLSPYILGSTGEVSLVSAPELPRAKVDANFDNYGLGTSFYLGRNFVIKAEYRWYSSSIFTTEKLEAWRIGFNTFF